jgi:WD40 repeat protein
MRIFAAIFAVAVLAGAARAEELPDQRPILRIEPGMHTAPIQRVGVDAACTLMVTGSDDKTARLWALPEDEKKKPELLRTLRVPIGDGDNGKIYAVAISPDGKWVAAGGWDAKAAERREDGVYIFEPATGRLVTRLGGLGNVIKHISFSPDGSRLAAALWGGKGMHLWETGSWRQIAEDKDYGGKDSYGLAFDSANRLTTLALDGQIRRYGADGRLEAKAAAQGGKLPFSVAVHPLGSKLAIGFADTKAVEVYDARTLKRLYTADTSRIEGENLGRVAWGANGAQLYAAGRFWGTNPVIIWQDEGRGKRSQAPVSRNTIMQLLPCGNGVAAGAQDPAFGLIAADGAKRVWQEGVTADMRLMLRDRFTVSADAKRVRFGLAEDGHQPFLFDLDAFRLTEEPKNVAGLAEPRISGLPISDWENELAPKLNGKPIALGGYERSRALAIAPDALRFVLGTEWALRAYRADGGELWPSKAVPGTAWGVNISGNGNLVVAAYGDGTIRWHRISDGQELLALFVHAKDKRYVAWTPKGYYAASPGAEDLFGWHVNRDWDHAPDFYPASRFRDQFNRPDIVKRVLDDLDEDKAIEEANKLAGSKPAEEITKRLPPVITILAPAESSAFTSDSLTVSYSVRSPSALAITEVSALADGRPIKTLQFKGLIPVSASEDSEKSLILTGLPARDLNLSLVARAGDIESTRATVALKYRGAAPEPISLMSATGGGGPTGSLYALVVGVGKFKDAGVPGLNYAGKDARDFAAALKQQEGRLYRKVEVRLFAEETASHDAILNGLVWLRRQVGRGDAGVVFLSGHGVTDPTGDYYYVPYNAEMENVGGIQLPTRTTAVPDSEISHALKQLAGNAFFLFDTCHAGKAAGITYKGGNDYNKLINEIAGSANAVVLASSTGSELSQERAEWQHGAFTQAILEGLSGAADYNKDGVVSVDELNLYVKERVKKLTGGLQHPVDLKPKEARDFDFAMVP